MDDKEASFDAERKRLQAIQSAIGANDVAALKALDRDDAPVVEYKDGDGATAVHWAARAGSVDVLKYVVEHAGVESATALDNKGRSPLMAACATVQGDAAVAYLCTLAEVRQTINQPTEGPCALHLAAAHSVKATKLLIEAGADVNAPSPSGGTPLHHCLANVGPEACALALIDAGANIDAKDENDATPLILACLLGNAAIANKLIEKGANVAAFAKNLSPLAAAAVSNSLECAEALLRKDANLVHLRDPQENLRPVEVAAHACNISMCEFLASRTDSSLRAADLVRKIAQDKVQGDVDDAAKQQASEEASVAARDKGNALFRQGQYRNAAVAYSEGLSGLGANASVRSRAVLLTNMSLCTFKQDDWASSRMMAQQAAQLDPSYVKGQVRLGAACEKLGDFESAATAYWAAYNVDKISKDAGTILKMFNVRLFFALWQRD